MSGYYKAWHDQVMQATIFDLPWETDMLFDYSRSLTPWEWWRVKVLRKRDPRWIYVPRPMRITLIDSSGIDFNVEQRWNF